MCSHNSIKFASSSQIFRVRTNHFSSPLLQFLLQLKFIDYKSMRRTCHIRWASVLPRVKLQAQRVEHRLSYTDGNYSNQIRIGMSTSTGVNNFITCVEEHSLTRDLVCLSELVCFWTDRCILFVSDHSTHTHTFPQADIKSHALNYFTFTPGKKPRANCLRPD